MNGSCDQVFADAAFTSQQHSSARRRHTLDGGEDFLHRRTSADDIVELIALA